MDQPATQRRSGFRFSLKTLLLAVVPVAIGAAALRSATYAWGTTIVTATLLAFFAAIIAAQFDARHRRPLWFGFTICLGGYFLLLFTASDPLVDALGTEELNAFAFGRLHPDYEYTYPFERRPFVTSQATPVKVQDRSLAKDEFPRQFQQPSMVALQPHTALGDILATTAEDSNGDATPLGTTSATGVEPAAASPADQNATGAASGPDNPDAAAKQDDNGQLGECFGVIARCAWAWLFGFAGAAFARYLALRHQDAELGESATPPTPSSCPVSRRFRPRIVGLAIFPVAIFVAAVKTLDNPGYFGASLAVSFAAFGALAAAISAAFGTRGRRPFRCGFALCCGAYLLLIARADYEPGNYAMELSVKYLVSAQLMVSFHDHRFPDQDPLDVYAPSTFGGPLPVVGLNTRTSAADPNPTAMADAPEHVTVGEHRTVLCQEAGVATADASEADADQDPPDYPQQFLDAGHSYSAILLGWLGGVFAMLVNRRNSGLQTARLENPAVPAMEGSG